MRPKFKKTGDPIDCSQSYGLSYLEMSRYVIGKTQNCNDLSSRSISDDINLRVRQRSLLKGYESCQKIQGAIDKGADIKLKDEKRSSYFESTEELVLKWRGGKKTN